MKRIDKRMVSNKRKFIPVFLILVLFVALGFAALSATLGINGTTVVEISYDVHFANVEDVAGDMQVEKSATINPDDDTKIDFAVVLTKPGEYYEFETDIVNTGKLDAYLGNIEILGLDEEASKYLDISYRYTDGEVNQYDLLEAGETARLNVIVKFNYDIDSTPAEGTLYNLGLDLTYIHNNGSGIYRIKGTYLKQFDTIAYLDSIPSPYVLSDYGINFNESPSKYNGNGIYIRSGSENDKYPIYYFRGNVNNNVLFADYCWKIVRTTEQGGIKLIYNGKQDYARVSTLIDRKEYNIISNDNMYPYDFDQKTLEWTSTNHGDSTTSSIQFGVNKPGDYVINYTISSESCCDVASLVVNGKVENENIAGTNSSQIYLNDLSVSDIIEIKYKKDGSVSQGDDSITFSVGRIRENLVKTCDNYGEDSQISVDGINEFMYNASSNLIEDVGYMYGDKYEYTSWTDTPYIYADDVSFDGEVYTLIQPSESVIKGVDSRTKHYTCKLTDSGVCNVVYYAYNHYPFGNNVNAVKLTNGNTIDEYITSVFNNKSNSNVKSIIDEWFEKNLTNIIDKKKIDYRPYLEDAVWCNARKIESGALSKNNYYINQYTNFETYMRIYSNGPVIKDEQACSNKYDRFTLSDTSVGNGKLSYSIGLLTADEVYIAGRNSYLTSGSEFWTMSPADYTNYREANVYYVNSEGRTSSSGKVSYSKGIRPSIVLKNGTIFSSGDGSGTNPFVVK